MKRIFNAMLFAGAVLMTVSCGNGKNETESSSAGIEELPAVKVVEVFAKDVDVQETYTSTVLPYAKNNIAPQSPNRIDKINVEIGDFVKEGQILAEMDKVQLLQTELQMKNNESEFNRIKGLYEAGAVSKSDMEAMELGYKVSRSAYENLLENSVLSSPINGVVSARNYDEGDMFSPQFPIFVVEQISPVKLLVAVSEKDYANVKKGDAVSIEAAAYDGKVFNGRVNRVYPVVDQMTHTVTVEVQVPNRDYLLRPGMYAKVEVTFGTNHHVVVPDIAVVKQSGSGERFVYVLNPDNTVSYRKVTLGRRLGAEYEIVSGIPEGSKVVTEGQIRLKDGVKVTVAK